MPSREMIYRVSIDTGSARREAQNLRKSIEAELKNINTGKINVGGATGVAGGVAGIGGATAEMSLFEKAVSSGAKRIKSELTSIALGYIGIQAAIGAVNAAVGLARLQTEASRAGKSFEILSGGADKAQLNIAAIQRASNNTVDSLTAMKIGTQAAALGLANTSAEFERLVAAAKLIVQVSPTINDIGDALTQLALFSSNEASFARADQLGLAASEVKDRIKELRAENENLTGSQAKLEASIQIVTEKFGGLGTTLEAQATGLERLTVAWTEFKLGLSEGTGFVQDFTNSLASGLNQATVMLAGTRAPVSVLIQNLTELEKTTRTIEEADPFAGFLQMLTGTSDTASQRLAIVRDALSSALSAVDEGIPGSGKILQDVIAIATSVDQWNDATTDQITSIKALSSELNALYANGGQAVAAAITAEEAAAAAAAQRADSILAQAEPISGGLQSRASKSVDVVGLEAAIAQLREQKIIVDQAITDLIGSGVTDSDEIALRIDQIQQQAIAAFDAMEERAADFSFDAVPDAFANIFAGLNSADSDFIPFLEGLRDDSISLFEEIAAAGGTVTEEQAMQLDFLSSAAAAASDEMSPLAGIVNELGIEFISTNEYAGELIGQLYESQAALAAGQISAEEYAGRISAIGGALIAYIQQMGGATSATYALIAAQSGLSGTPGFATGFSFGGATANAAKLQADARSRDRIRREAESAAKRAASEAERAAKRAGAELERGAKKARQELENALQSVPGLFKRSDVTQKQLDAAKAGVPQNFADDYIRRLEDEVVNGKDWADVSIEEAKAGLAKVGIVASDNNKIALDQFITAWEDFSLFADKSNLAFINQEAVKLQLDLQEKSKQGQANIYELFGIAVDDAVEAVGAGLSAGGGSGSVATGYTIPVTAELTPIPQSEFEPGGTFAPPVVTPTARPVQGPLPQSAFMPTLGGMSPVVDVAAIQGQLNALTITPTIDVSTIDYTEPLAAITAGLTPSITATITDTFVSAAAYANYETIKGNLTPHITASVDSMILAAQASTDFDIIKKNLTPHITATVESLGFSVDALTSVDAVGSAAADIIKGAIASHIGTTEWVDGQIVAPIADGLITSINTQIRGSVEGFKREGGGVAELIKSGLAQSISTTEWADGEMVAPIATGLITAINTQVRGNVEGFRREGKNVASLVMFGLGSSWTETDTQGNATNGLALGLLGALNMQLGATQNFFYAAGYTPAASVLDGFKGTFAAGDGTALMEPLLTAIGTGIRTNTENFRQRGGTVAREMLNGFTTQFNNEEFKNVLIAAGETMGAYLEIGILSRIRGGALVEAIGAQVLADITATVEEPAP